MNFWVDKTWSLRQSYDFSNTSEVTQNDLGEKKISQYLSQQNITKGQDVHDS